MSRDDKITMTVLVVVIVGVLSFGSTLGYIESQQRSIRAEIGTEKFDTKNAHIHLLLEHIVNRLDSIEKKLDKR
jgi:hypothetical protein